MTQEHGGSGAAHLRGGRIAHAWQAQAGIRFPLAKQGGRPPCLQQLQRRWRARQRLPQGGRQGGGHQNSADTLTGVNDADDQLPFIFTGTLKKLTIKIDRPQLSGADTTSLQAAMRTKAISE